MFLESFSRIQTFTTVSKLLENIEKALNFSLHLFTRILDFLEIFSTVSKYLEHLKISKTISKNSSRRKKIWKTFFLENTVLKIAKISVS